MIFSKVVITTYGIIVTSVQNWFNNHLLDICKLIPASQLVRTYRSLYYIFLWFTCKVEQTRYYHGEYSNELNSSFFLNGWAETLFTCLTLKFWSFYLFKSMWILVLFKKASTFSIMWNKKYSTGTLYNIIAQLILLVWHSIILQFVLKNNNNSYRYL